MKSDDDIVGRELASHDLASYEVSKRDNIRNEVKFFIRTIPESEIVDNTAVPKRDIISGLPNFVDFDVAWNTMVYELHTEETPSKMITKIAHLAHDKNNPFFKMLEARISKQSDNFITKFWNTMYSHRHDYISIAYNANASRNSADYERSIRIISSNIERGTRVLPMYWGQSMLAAGKVYSTTEEGIVFNKDYAQSIVDRYSVLTKMLS